ncbi:MAG TPA: c-type cytochrome [Solirubrobacterales bacterium]|nr:c-type cytochrome [Solirubrobacterales bacterium]
MNRRPKLINLLLALVALGAIVVVATGCGTTTADPERGRVLFTQKCGTCHALAQAGTSATNGPNLDHAFASARETGMTDDTIEGVVKAQVELPRPNNGDPAVSMPKNIVTGQDLEDVAAYLGEWAGVPGAAPPKVPGGPGAQVFASKGCGSCHILAAAESGGTTGPNLDEVLVAGTTLEQIHEDIVDPDKDIAQGYSKGIMPSNFGESLTEKELEDLVQYLFENTPAGKGK